METTDNIEQQIEELSEIIYSLPKGIEKSILILDLNQICTNMEMGIDITFIQKEILQTKQQIENFYG